MALAKARAINAAFSPSYAPVAVFLGGTSGIGQAMAETFARYANGNARIVIVGRNKAAADKIISSFPRPTKANDTADPLHEFISCDATLMSNCQTATTHILSKYRKINFLVLSSGFLTLKGRDETSEGIDKKLALNYYARWKFINDLMPALRKAKEDGEEAKVMSVLAAGKGGEIDLDDLGLKKGYGVMKASLVAPTYNDLMMEEFASQNPTLSFAHVFPGVVKTPIIGSIHPILKPLAPLAFGLMFPFTVSAETCAEYMWSALFGAKDGASRWGSQGEDIGRTRYFGNEEGRRRLWAHTVEATRVKA